MSRVTARPLTAEDFAPFGQVIPLRVPLLGRRAHAAALANRRPAAVPGLAVARVAPTAPPIRAAALERHPFSSQTFVPTDLERYIVVVCPADADGEPLVTRVLAFVAVATQGVSYAPGTWHHPMTVLDRPGEYVVLRWDDGTAADTEWRHLADPVLVDVAE
jgi:ureidoglycolate lyase